MDKTERKSSLSELTNHINLAAILGEWKKLLDSAQKYEFMSESERKEINETVFDSEKFEKLAAETYDLFALYAEGYEVPKYIMNLYFVLRSFASIDYIKSVGKGALQFRTAIATSLYHLLDEQYVLDDDKIIVIYMDENQSVVEPGYYFYNLNTFLYSYIGAENPFSY